MDDPNPFEAPQSVLVGPRRRRGRLRWRLAGGLAVFLLNLPIAMAAATLSREDSWIGIAAGLLALLALGLAICCGPERASTPLMVGGIGIALFQLVPIPHVIAGFIGLQVTHALGLTKISELVDSWAAGLGVTLVTGLILMKLAFGFGTLLLLLAPARWRAHRPGHQAGEA